MDEGSCLKDLNIPEEGLLVLGPIRDDGDYLGVPRGGYQIRDSEHLIIFGKPARIRGLCERDDALEGEVAHDKSVIEHKDDLEEQDERAMGDGKDQPSISLATA